MTTNSFLGTGWNFPPAFTKNAAGVEMISNEADIQSSLEILLTTRPGERVMRPDYGCNLDELLFEPLTTTFKTYIKDLVSTAILYHEPRIEVNKIELDDSGNLLGIVMIAIEYTIRSTNSRYNYVFPFYRAEGTEVK
ncbi:MAG: GPW/gp25 family protein [Chitinophagaceae bacterium]|nr:GPW/gp25 family protein [Chitinophagaceae bacterium]